MIRNYLLCVLICVSMFSGCYVDPAPGSGTTVTFVGDITDEDGRFKMTGTVQLQGGTLEKEAYKRIQLELYTKSGDLIYKEQLGTLRDFSEALDVAVNISDIPYYIILDSPNIWQGPTSVDYWVREPGDGYHLRRINNREELPIEPDG